MGFDPFAPAALRDPHPVHAAWRVADPVHHSDKLRAWVLFRHDDVAAALRDGQRFSADRRRAARGGGAANAASPSIESPARRLRTVTSDPPDGAVVRGILNAALAPRVRALAPRIEAMVEELLERVTAVGRFDLVSDFAYPLPIRVIAELLEVPAADGPRFQKLSSAVARGMDRFHGGPEAAVALREMGAYFLQRILASSSDASATPPEDGLEDLGLMRALLRLGGPGEKLDDLEATAMCTALVFGGHETTVNLISSGVLALLQNPTERERLTGDPDLDGPAVEELLRFVSPPQFVSRVLSEETELRGRQLLPGETVLLGIASANRDPEVFSDPDRLDLTRAPNPHLAFGMGMHACPGAQLARLEARAAIGALVRRLPDLRLDGAPRWRPTFILRGLEQLPVATR